MATKKTRDPEMEEFAAGLLEAARDMKAGNSAETHAAEAVRARIRARGRPPGSVAASKLESLNMRMEPATMAKLRSLGAGWQTKLRAYVARAVDTDLDAIAHGEPKSPEAVGVPSFHESQRQAVARHNKGFDARKAK